MHVAAMRRSGMIGVALLMLLVRCSASAPSPGDQGGDTDEPTPDVDEGFAGDAAETDEAPGDDNVVTVDRSPGCDTSFTRPSYGENGSGFAVLPLVAVPGTGGRTVRPYVPTTYDHTTARPLVVFLHGGGANAQYQWEHATLQALAERENVIVAMPDGLNASGNVTPHTFQTWNGGGCCGNSAATAVDDVGFIDAVVAYLESTLCIDRERVFAAGFSNGGIMAYRLACDLPERFAAFASIAGPNMTTVGTAGLPAVGCAPSRRLALLHIHGTADENAPYAGGSGVCTSGGNQFTAVADYVGAWAIANGCASGSDALWTRDGLVTDSRQSPCVTVGGVCPEATTTVLCSLEGGGHGYPQADDSALCAGDPPAAAWFDASRAMWTFFSEHARPRP